MLGTQPVGTSEGGEEIFQLQGIADISSRRAKLRRGSSSGRRGHIESARKGCEEEVVRGVADITSRRAGAALRK